MSVHLPEDVWANGSLAPLGRRLLTMHRVSCGRLYFLLSLRSLSRGAVVGSCGDGLFPVTRPAERRPAPWPAFGPRWLSRPL